MAEEWVWPGGGPQQPGYESRELAQDAAIGYLVERGRIGDPDPVGGTRWIAGQGDWRPVSSLPDGFIEGHELRYKNVDTGQQVLRRETTPER
jgi:hypothetical protein